LSLHDLGETGGSDTVTLLPSEIPSHTHKISASAADGTDQTPQNTRHATGVGILQYTTAAATTPLSSAAVSIVGGSLPHNNLQPYLALNFCIALQGVFPPRT
jgi:microcystin-dependent protein